MKVKLFTHTDLDGVFCSMLLQLVPEFEVDVDYCTYDNIDPKIQDFINHGDYTDFERIYITDISTDIETASMLNGIHSQVQVKLVDHHQTAKWMNPVFNWALVATEIDGVTQSAASVLYEVLSTRPDFSDKYSSKLDRIVETVRRYDTWEWKDLNDGYAKNVNELLYILGRDRFIDSYLPELDATYTIRIGETERLLLDLEREKIDSYLYKLTHEIDIMDIELLGKRYNVGFLFADRNVSEAGNYMCDKYNLDIVFLINPARSVSLRTNKEDINLGLIAEKFGGGGHPKAAGIPIDSKTRSKFYKDIMVKISKNFKGDKK
jgi:oligoribonuclease NrnB/cAMP/cGMP phosphodiesterase (DHH superfamily)